MCYLFNPNVAFATMYKSEKTVPLFLSVMLLVIFFWGQ